MSKIFIIKIGILIFSIVIFTVSCVDKKKVLFETTYKDNFTTNSFSNWHPNIPGNWEVINENGEGVLHLIKEGTFGEIRKPSSYAILNNLDVTNFELTVEAKCLVDTSIVGRDLIVVFGFQDSVHFYYTHISNHNHKVQNIIGLVNGKDRVPITNVLSDNSKKRLTDYEWHKIKVIRIITTGRIEVFVDDMKTPIHSIIDTTLVHGKVGLGSFDDYGKFKNFVINYDEFY